MPLRLSGREWEERKEVWVRERERESGWSSERWRANQRVRRESELGCDLRRARQAVFIYLFRRSQRVDCTFASRIYAHTHRKKNRRRENEKVREREKRQRAERLKKKKEKLKRRKLRKKERKKKDRRDKWRLDNWPEISCCHFQWTKGSMYTRGLHPHSCALTTKPMW